MAVNQNARTLRNNPTEAEKALWSRLKMRQLGFKFRRQHPVDPYIVDFYRPLKKLAIEVDGGQHTQDADLKRTEILAAQGIQIIRFWNNEVLSNINGVVEVIEMKLKTLPPLTPPSRGREGGES